MNAGQQFSLPAITPLLDFCSTAHWVDATIAKGSGIALEACIYGCRQIIKRSSSSEYQMEQVRH